MMPFTDPFDVYYEKLYRPAIEDANLQPVRADDLFRPSVIVADLWAMIQQAKVLLAELTTKNANVFYELGLAHAVGKPVVLVSETMSDVPFDLQQLRVLLYNKNDSAWGDKLASNLTLALKETLAAPIEAVPNIFRTRVESKGPKQDATDARLESLERQLTMLRIDQVRERDAGRSGTVRPMDELIGVHSPTKFDEWVRRWSAVGVPTTDLRRMVLESGHIPKTEARRIPSIVKNMNDGEPIELE